MSAGVVLYGPPAAGKDTVTGALQTISQRYVLFPRLKIGQGRTEGYRMIDPARLEELRSSGELVWVNSRYGATYAIDRPALIEHLANHVSVIHVGQPEAIPAVMANTPDCRWLVVYLWCSRTIAVKRLRGRSSQDVSERLRAWDETAALTNANLTIDTGAVEPEAAAGMIHQHVTSGAAH